MANDRKKLLRLLLQNYWEKLRELQKKIDIPFRNKSTIFELENQFKNQSLTDKNSR